jgi:hypothetical protein
MMNCTLFAEPAQQNPTAFAVGISATLRTSEQLSQKIEQDCEDEWRANREAIMKGGMTEDSYVKQCSVKDDVPPLAPKKPKKTNGELSSAPNRSPDR